ncbi:hypothetical protein BD770DRAFT_432719 [Pilaira anomala]|nr:hypothetical protein BD770DRAFT_432719 [Pilaira anomala]
MHLYSNIAKELFEMISPKYSESYKFIGNQKEYPFSLPEQAFDDIKKIMKQSRQFISASSFKSSWLALDVSNVKSCYRSADWMDFLVYCIPTTIASQFEDIEVRSSLLNLCPGISLSLQFSITEKNLKEIEKISNCVLRVNMHQLSHIPEMIRQCYIYTLWIICKINGKRDRSRVKSGENANIILERIALYSFLRNTEIMNFESAGKQVDDSSNTFLYHPSGNKDYGQLWAPFYKEFKLEEIVTILLLAYSFGDDASFYAIVEMMKSHRAAQHSKFIPVVISFAATETKKFVVVDVGDIISVVGLQKSTKEKNTYFVITPSTAFDSEMKTTAGSLINLC